MQTIGNQRLLATTTESSYPLPSNCRRLDLTNASHAVIRYSFVTGKVNDPSILENVTYLEFETLHPGQSQVHVMRLASGTLYYASNFDGAEFHVTPYID